MAPALPSPAVQPRRHPSSTDTIPAAKLSCRMCETALVLREANGGNEDIFWNIQIVRTFSLNVLAIAESPETLPRLFEQEDRRNNAIRNSRPHLAVAHGITKHEHHEVRRRRPLRTHRQCFCCREPSRLCNTERLSEVSAEADCDTSICKWSGSSCAASDATMTAVQSIGAAGSGWATLEAEKLALCKADADCSILAANMQTFCSPTCEAVTISICTNADGTCTTNGLSVQSDDCISSGFMTNDYKVSGASSIMASTVILAFIAAGLATFA